jgi:bacillithiol biosynthesis deacetylase BshB1
VNLDLIAFGAHPDDVELFCGGTVIRHAQLGYRVGVVDLTRGEAASNGTPELRAQEAAAASACMQLTHRENLCLPDIGLDPHAPAQVEVVVAALRRLRPALVLIPWTVERHPDHVAASQLVQRAIFMAGLRSFRTSEANPCFQPDQVLFYAMRHRFAASLVVDISAFAEQKYRAIACHRSQLTPAPGGVPTLVGSPQTLQLIEARDRYYGSLIGTAHAEPLRMQASLGVSDLVKQFRDNPFPRPQFFEAD